MDNLPATDLATRKKAMVQELNGFITAKKEFTQAQAAKLDLIGAGGTPHKGGSGLPKSKDGTCSCLVGQHRPEKRKGSKLLLTSHPVVMVPACQVLQCRMTGLRLCRHDQR